MDNRREEIMKRRKRRRLIRRIQRDLVLLGMLLVLVGIIWLIKLAVVSIIHHVHKETAVEETVAIETVEFPTEETIESETEIIEEEPIGKAASEDAALFYEGYRISDTGSRTYIDAAEDEMNSSYAILINLETGDVVAQKKPDTIISPASMTKILTVLTASDYITDLNDTIVMDEEIPNYVYVHDCSAVGFMPGDRLTIEDLLYGTILPSGADAALALADYVAGSQEEFVKLMNAKVKELGLSQTAHFDNCTGIYSETNKCTVGDMAMILKAAMERDICRQVLSAHSYTTSSTPDHPEGITISNWFLRRIEDKETGGEVIGAKTGFVVQSGSCAASYFKNAKGTPYICVTGNAHSSWRCIYDHVYIYSTYATD